MKQNHLLYMAIVLVALILLIKFVGQEEDDKSLGQLVGMQRILPKDVSATKTKRIELGIVGKDPSVVLTCQKDGEWVISSRWDAPALKMKVDSFLKAVDALEGEPVSRDKSSHKDYRVGENAVVLHLIGEGEAATTTELFVGKSRSENSGSFVRRKGEDDVFECGVNLRAQMDMYDLNPAREPDHGIWLKKRIIEMDKKKINGLSLVFPDHKLVFKRHATEVPAPETDKTPDMKTPPEEKSDKPKTITEYEWKLEEGGVGKHNESELNNILTAIAAFDIKDVLDPAKATEYGFDKPAYLCTVQIEGGDPIVIEGMRKRGGNTYLRLKGSPFLYQISNYSFEKLFTTGEHFFELKKPAVDEKKVTAIRYTRGGKTMEFRRENEKTDWTTRGVPAGKTLYQWAVNDIIDSLSHWSISDYADPVQDDTYGLKSPTAKVSVTQNDGKTITLLLGKAHPYLEGFYVIEEGPDKSVLIMKETNGKRAFPDFDHLYGDPIPEDKDAAKPVGPAAPVSPVLPMKP